MHWRFLNYRKNLNKAEPQIANLPMSIFYRKTTPLIILRKSTLYLKNP